MARFAVTHRCGAARCGMLVGVPTPMVLPQSRLCQVPYLPQDVLEATGVAGVATKFADFAPLAGTMATSGLTAAAMAGTGRLLVHASLRDADTPPSASTDKWFAATTLSGVSRFAPDEFVEVLKAIQPHLAVTLADEIAWSRGGKRAAKSVARTKAWLARCMARAGELSGTLLLGSVVGAGSTRYRTERYSLAEMDMGGSPSERLEVVRQLLRLLPVASKPVHAAVVGSPLELLDMVNEGVDVLSSCYPLKLTQDGCASVYWIDDALPFLEHGDDDRFKINLRERKYARDSRPLLPGCPCPACTKHTRAYVHHLLNVKEILGLELLHVHNLTHEQLLMRHARLAIERGGWPEFVEQFRSRCCAEL